MSLSSGHETSLCLQNLGKQFDQWRAARSYRRERVPEQLRQQAVALLADHTTTQIIAALGITRNMLRHWRTHYNQTPPVSEEFVPAALEASPASKLSLTVAYPDGTQMTLSGDVSLAQLTAAMRGLKPGREDVA